MVATHGSSDSRLYGWGKHNVGTAPLRGDTSLNWMRSVFSFTGYFSSISASVSSRAGPGLSRATGTDLSTAATTTARFAVGTGTVGTPYQPQHGRFNAEDHSASFPKPKSDSAASGCTDYASSCSSRNDDARDDKWSGAECGKRKHNTSCLRSPHTYQRTCAGPADLAGYQPKRHRPQRIPCSSEHTSSSAAAVRGARASN